MYVIKRRIIASSQKKYFAKEKINASHTISLCESQDESIRN